MAEAAAFAKLAEHMVLEPRSLQPLRQQASGEGTGGISLRGLRAEVAGMRLALTEEQLNAIARAASAVLQPSGAGPGCCSRPAHL
eukprot:COSAG06_NODE_28822_length_567_cov_1.185897_1_plen_84_part_10